MSKRAPSPMWVEISVGLSLQTVPPRGGAWTLDSLAAHHAFDIALVTRAVESLAAEGRPEAIALIPIAAEAIPAAAAPVEGQAPGADPPVSSADPSQENPIDDAAVKSTRDEAAVEAGSRRADARTPVEAGGVRPLAPSTSSILESIAEEVRETGERRRLASVGGGSLRSSRLSPVRVAVERELLASPEDGFAFLRRKWPNLLHRVVADGHADGVLPGPMLAQVIEAGLDTLALSRGEAPPPSILSTHHEAVR